MGRRILVADGSPSIRKSIGSVLKKEGYDVVEASDGPEALKAIVRCPVDLVVCDMNMPTMDGISFVKKMNEGDHRDTDDAVPVIMMTTESGEEKKQEGRLAGITMWITKPFSPDAIAETIRKTLQ